MTLLIVNSLLQISDPQFEKHYIDSNNLFLHLKKYIYSISLKYIVLLKNIKLSN